MRTSEAGSRPNEDIRADPRRAIARGTGTSWSPSCANAVTTAMDLPCDDDSAGPAEYADSVVGALGQRRHLVLVAQSFGGFTAPLVCQRVPVDLMVLVAPMIPSPGGGAE
jgi:alpha-beta hydrolase superfamily lysophospholipase